MNWNRSSATLTLIALLAAGGCEGPRGDLAGRVLVAGRPVVAGTILATDSDGTTWKSTISPDGSYAIRGLRAGPVNLGVVIVDSAAQSHMRQQRNQTDPRLARSPIAAGKASESPAVPVRYAEPLTSGLSFQIKPGANRHDLLLD